MFYFLFKSGKTEYDDYSNIVLPGDESVRPHYAIFWRNDRMFRQFGHVVTYNTHAWGGAAHYVRKAKDQKKNGAQPAIAYP